MTDFSKMGGPELVKVHNSMVNAAAAKGFKAAVVKRFADTKSGIRRCEALEAAINGEATSQPRKRNDGLIRSNGVTAEPVIHATITKRTSSKVPEAVALANEFAARPNSVREKLLLTLAENFGQQVKVSALLKAVYGSQNADNTGALNMSIKGAISTIGTKQLPYELKKEKDKESKEISFGLYRVV